MARPLRIEYAGARYHVVSRGDSRDDIFFSEADRVEFLRTLGQACRKTGWQVHAYCLMTNHFHLVLETPQANLATGMKWLLGTYTQRFNRRHRRWGHLFGGRYKAQSIDERSPEYLRAACDYVHLNTVRARMIAPEQALHGYRWSSYPAYLRPKLREPWLRVDRLLAEHGLEQDTAANRREFSRRLEHARELSPDDERLRCGWKIGAEDFSDWLADKLSRRRHQEERPQGRAETDAVFAERMVLHALTALRWREIELATQPKGHPAKVRLAQQLRAETPMSRRCIADRLRMGSPSYVSNLLNSVNSKF